MSPLLNSNRKALGAHYEQRAQALLCQHGLVPVQQNFRAKGGEIDLIMRDDDTWVFVEVKYRSHSDFGGAIAAISHAQIGKIRRTAQLFLLAQGLSEAHTPCRFDVVAFDNQTHEWLKNAF